jgi:hypothetical protein
LIKKRKALFYQEFLNTKESLSKLKSVILSSLSKMESMK